MELNESRTRSLLINPQLVAAGWKLNDRSLVRFEIPVDGYDAEPWNGVTDYCLYDFAGNVLVIKAKRTSRGSREAGEQLRHYVTEIANPRSHIATSAKVCGVGRAGGTSTHGASTHGAARVPPPSRTPFPIIPAPRL